MKTVLGISAHPDDLEILCGGTLARFAGDGCRVVMAYLTNGDKGHYDMASEELVELRTREAQAAAAVIGAESVTLGLPDAQLFSDLATRNAVIDLIRRIDPDIVIGLHPHDYSSDHRVASELAENASFLAGAALYRTDEEATQKRSVLVYADAMAGAGVVAEDFVDITETLETKLEMLRCHKSQLDWLAEFENTDITELVTSVARFRGIQCGVQYAEAFCYPKTWGRRAPRRVLP